LSSWENPERLAGAAVPVRLGGALANDGAGVVRADGLAGTHRVDRVHAVLLGVARSVGADGACRVVALGSVREGRQGAHAGRLRADREAAAA